MSLKIDKVQLDIIINNDPARKELRQLEDDLKKTQKALKKLTEGSAEWVKKSEELKKIQLRIDEVRSSIGLTNMTMKELLNRQRELNFAMRNMNPNLPQYKALQAELRAVNNRMKELRGQAANTGMSVGGLAKGFNKYFSIIATVTASMTGLVFSFKKAIDTFNDYDAAVSNLSALTGLTGSNLDWLSEKAKELSVSTTKSGVKITSSAQDIVDAFMLVGSIKSELLDNKEALAEVTEQALILAEATKINVKDAVKSLTTVMNQFGAGAEEAGKYINVLAAGSKEGAAEVQNINDSLIKFGAAAKTANVPTEESVGLIETLAERGIMGDVAGTGIRNFLITLQKGANDTNPSVVGLSTALENLSKKGLSTNEVIDIFGKQNYIVAQTLISNTEKVKHYTSAVTGTNVALEQARVNTSNNSAALKQAQNRFNVVSIELGEKLAPALTSSTNGFTYLMKVVLAIINVYKEHSVLINSSIVGLIAYTTIVWGLAAAQKGVELATRAANLAMKAFNTSSMASVWGAIVGLITTATTALISYNMQKRKAIDSTELYGNVLNDYKRHLGEEQAKLAGLFAQLKHTNKESEEREEIIKQINSTYGTTLENIDNEKEFVKQLDLAYQDLIQSLQKKALLQARQSGLVEVEQKKLDVQKPLEELLDLRDKMGFIDEAGNWTLKIGFKRQGSDFMNLLTKIKQLTPLVNKDLAELEKAKEKLLTFTGKDKELLESGSISPKGKGLTDEQKEKIQKELEARQKFIEGMVLKGKGAGEIENERYLEDLRKGGLLIRQLKEEERLMLLHGELADIESSGILKKNMTSNELLALEQIYETYLNNIEKINKEAFQKNLQERQKEYAEEKALLKSFLDKKIKEEQFRYEDAKLAKERELLDGVISEEQFNEQMLYLQNNYQLETEQLQLSHLYTLYEAKKKYNLDTINDEQELTNKTKELANKRIEAELKEYKFKNKKAEAEEALNKQQAENAIRQGDVIMQESKNFDEAASNTIKSIRAQIKAYIADAVAKSIANALKTAPFPFNIVIGTMAGTAAMALFNTIIPDIPTTKQYAEGNYPVIGEKDGRLYNAKFVGKAETGIVGQPSLYLAGEKGPEMIIDYPTLQIPEVANMARMIEAIKFNKIPQYAEGSYPIVSPASTGMNMSLDMLKQLTFEVGRLSDQLDLGVEANIRWDNLKRAERQAKQVENNIVFRK